MRSGKKNTDRTRNEADTDDSEKHLHERFFDPHEYLHKQSYPGDEHRQGNQNVCVQHAIPSLSFTQSFDAICGLLFITQRLFLPSGIPPCRGMILRSERRIFNDKEGEGKGLSSIFTIGEDRSPLISLELAWH